MGVDEGTPVTEDYKEQDNRFTGKIEKVTVEVKVVVTVVVRMVVIGGVYRGFVTVVAAAVAVVDVDVVVVVVVVLVVVVVVVVVVVIVVALRCLWCSWW